MREFFQGWRRKAGLGTLVMACVLTGAWMRSLVAEDELMVLTNKRSQHRVVIVSGGIHWEVSPPSSGLNDRFPQFGWFSRDYQSPTKVENMLAEPADYEWVVNLCGFFFGAGRYEYRNPAREVARWVLVSHSLLVLPLTLLSAWLILGKHRKSSPATAR